MAATSPVSAPADVSDCLEDQLDAPALFDLDARCTSFSL